MGEQEVGPREPSGRPEAMVDAAPVEQVGALERFFEEVDEQLVPPYLLDRRGGLILRETGEGKYNSICAPVLVTDLLRSPAETQSFLRLRFLNLKGDIQVLDIPNDDLGGSAPKGVEILRRAGLHMPANAREMAALLRSFRPQRQGESTVPPGWHPDGKQLFGLRDGRVVAPPGRDGEDLPFRLFEPAVERLERWKTEVAVHVGRNPYPLFALCHALSGPFMGLSGKGAFGVNIALATSSGKTTLARVLAGLWPECAVEGWENSDAGFEDLAVAANGSLLVLDEFPQDRVREAVRAIYRIMNGRARGVRRGPRGMSAVDTRQADWAMPVVSTSEEPIPALAGSRGVTVRGGVGVRMVDVTPAVLWPDHTGFASSFEMLQAIEASLQEHRGVAGPMLVRQILRGWDKVYGQLPALREKTQEQLLSSLRLTPGQATGATLRVVDHFVTIALAGQLAAVLKILPQSPADIRAAVSLVLRGALDPEPTQDAHAAALERLRDWLGRHATSRLAEIDDAGRPVGRHRGAHGWRSDSSYFLLPDTLMAAIGPGYRMPRFLQYLDEQGLLRRGRDPSSFQLRMGSRIHGRPYVYCIRREGFDLGLEETGDR